ncbi:hypothetical protein C8T65DRAFT_64090 [Cerioporus squamosus]|nr:hypothetical protein C8T65DRAFT_64090 [Cerioporus squamosus]
MPNASLDPPGSSQAGSQLESEEVGEERGGAEDVSEDKDTCLPVHALHHLPSLQHIPDRSTEPPSADEHREQQVSAVSGPKDLVQTRRMTMPPLLAQTGASLLDGGSPVSPQDRSQDAPAVEEPAEDTCNELHIEIIDLQTAVHREDDIGVGASDVDVGQTIAAEPVTAGTAPDDLVASSADPGSPFIKSAMASIRTTGEEGREGPGICRTTVGGPDVSLASIEAHTGTPNYGACPWNSDLERQGTGDDDASRPTRRLRREVVRRIACLVLGLLIGGVLSRPGTVSKSWRILRKLCARAASRTLTRRLYWQP